MAVFKPYLIFIATLAGSLTSFSASSEHDLYICAAVSRSYVIGSTIATTSGVLQRDEKGTWKHLGINDHTIFAMAFDPRDHDTFYTVGLNGVVRTLDGGRTWRIMTSWHMTEPKDICVDPNVPDSVYLALPDGVAVSHDQGLNWRRVENGLPRRGKYAQTIEVDRTEAGRVLVGCESGIYLMVDGADSWLQVLATDETVDDIQQSPHDSDTWIAVTQSAGAWMSEDGGITWGKLPGAPSGAALYNVAFDATNEKRLAIGSYTYGVLTSEDFGDTWTDRNSGLPNPHHVWRVGIDPDSGRLYASVYKSDLYISDDFGRTWRTADLEGSAVHNFVFLPKTQQP